MARLHAHSAGSVLSPAYNVPLRRENALIDDESLTNFLPAQKTFCQRKLHGWFKYNPQIAEGNLRVKIRNGREEAQKAQRGII
jgi:hypothetical protein